AAGGSGSGWSRSSGCGCGRSRCRRGWSKRCCRARACCWRRCRRRNVAVNESGALVYAGGPGAEGALNIVSPIEGYQRGVCALKGCLTHKDNVATQAGDVAQRILPDDVEELLFSLEEGAA